MDMSAFPIYEMYFILKNKLKLCLPFETEVEENDFATILTSLKSEEKDNAFATIMTFHRE